MVIGVFSAGTRSVLLNVDPEMYFCACGLSCSDPFFGIISVTVRFAIVVGTGMIFTSGIGGEDGMAFGDDFWDFAEILVEGFGDNFAPPLDGDRPEEDFSFTHSLFLLVFAMFKFVRDPSLFFEVPCFCEQIPFKDCKIIFLDLIGPRHITAGSVGMYDARAIGRETIRIEEKLSNPASTFTSSTSSGIIRSHSLNRSVESSLG
jgi:hypothetical protein